MRVQGALASEALAMYPATLSNVGATRVHRFLGDAEQRYSVRRELFAATLEFSKLGSYDLSVLLAFFRSQRGRYVPASLITTFDITIAGDNYQYCAFDQDEIDFSEDGYDSYSLALRIRQVRTND